MFVPYSQELTHPGSKPDKWIAVLHGIYGSGGNWRAFARKLCAQRPDWGVLLVDLPMHGKSQDAPAPYTLRSCAESIAALVMQREARGMAIEAILGHSFGGKVALDFRRMYSLGLHDHELATWIVDSSPAAPKVSLEEDSNIVVEVLRILRELPETFAKRSDFIEAFTTRGIAQPVAQWLAMNLQVQENGFTNLLNHRIMTSLLGDYYQQELWSVLQSGDASTQIAIASRSSAIAPQDKERLEQMSGQHGLVVHTVEGGHWLHVDAADKLVELVAESLR